MWPRCAGVATIPASDAKGEPEHQHIDLRFLFRTSAEIGELQTDEITAAAWRDAETVAEGTPRDRIMRAHR